VIKGQQVKLSRVRYFAVNLPIATGEYVMSHGRALTELETTVVEIQAEDGSTGFGEACTLGSNYIEGFAGSVRATLRELGPFLIGCDVFEPATLIGRMDQIVQGHLPAKAAIDAACLDLRGKLLGLPAYKLLGGRWAATYPVFHPISLASPEQMTREASEMADLGYRSWQLKLGNDPMADADRVRAVVGAIGRSAEFITSDANGGWTLGQAARFLTAIGDVDTYVEQPCQTIAETAQLRARSPKPFVVDEVIRTQADLLQCIKIGAADAVNIKPTRVGGLTKAALIRDTALAAGMMVMIDEPMGGDLAMAGIGHLATASEPAHLLAASLLTAAHVSRSAQGGTSGGPVFHNGHAAVGDDPGLGVQVDAGALGEPVLCSQQG
jgi:cis-L-3-hydroxyproline dehydratase